jgi:hypothetical protein
MESPNIARQKGVQNSTIGWKSDETFLGMHKGQFWNADKTGTSVNCRLQGNAPELTGTKRRGLFAVLHDNVHPRR